MSHSDSRHRFRWTILASLVLFILGLGASTVALAAPHQYTAGAPTGDPYEDEVQGAGTAEGDVWGGEQGTVPEGPGELLPAEPLVSTLDAARAGWLVRLAAMFAWLKISPWFSNQE